MQYFDPAVTGETSVHKEGLVVFFTRLAMASVCVAGLGVGLAGPVNAADPHAVGTVSVSSVLFLAVLCAVAAAEQNCPQLH